MFNSCIKMERCEWCQIKHEADDTKNSDENRQLTFINDHWCNWKGGKWNDWTGMSVNFSTYLEKENGTTWCTYCA